MKAIQELKSEKYLLAKLKQEEFVERKNQRQERKTTILRVSAIIFVFAIMAWQMPNWGELGMNYLESNGFV